MCHSVTHEGELVNAAQLRDSRIQDLPRNKIKTAREKTEIVNGRTRMSICRHYCLNGHYRVIIPPSTVNEFPADLLTEVHSV
jgi:hypothetical protein